MVSRVILIIYCAIISSVYVIIIPFQREIDFQMFMFSQARYFKEQDIDEFRDCFYLNTASRGQIVAVDELKTIMRSLGMSPTLPELQLYLKEKGMNQYITLERLLNLLI